MSVPVASLVRTRRAAAIGAGLTLAGLVASTAIASEPIAPRSGEPVEPESRPRLVQADGPDMDELGDEPTLLGSADIGIFAEQRPDAQVASVSPHLDMGIRPHPSAEVMAGFGVVSTVINGPEGKVSTTRASNMTVAASRVVRWSDDKFREAKIGFAFAIPTSIARDDDERLAYEYALGGRGGWNPWEWTPTTLGLVLPAQIRAQVWRRLVVGADAGLAGLFPSVDNTAAPSLVAQGAGVARYVTRWAGVGVRMSAVYNGQREGDRSQVAVAPFADASLCRRGGRRIQGTFAMATQQCPVYATAKFNFNIDAPFGYTAEDAMRVWGLTLGLGWAVF